MPLSYDYIEKPTHVALIDQFFSGTPEDLRNAYDYARSILEQGTAIEETTAQVSGSEHEALQALTQDDADHFRAHWLDPETGLHPWSGPEVGEIMRAAYLDAVDAASRRDDPVPIETFWVFSPVERFEMRVSESTTQITVFVLIPKTPEIEFAGPRADTDTIRRFGPEESKSY